MLKKSLLEFINLNSNEFINIRRHLHQHPELSWEEVKTTEYIADHIKRLGLSYTKLDKTGLYVDFIINPDLPIIIFRADIDALPILEETNQEYESKNKGVAHSCGHDFHTTVAIALVYVLHEFRDRLKKNIRVLFQPAEEVVPSGAKSLASTAILKNVDHIFAIHSEPNLPAGKISIVDGWVTSQYINYYITLYGKNGHVAHPYRSNDVIHTASRIITDLYGMMNRSNRYDQFFTMTFSMIEAGKKINVIPDKLTLNGSLRISAKDKVESIQEFIDKHILAIADTGNVKTKIEHVIGPPPVENDPELADKFREIAKTCYDANDIVQTIRTMGSEDFSYYLEHTKGCYMRVGISNEHINESLHSSKFDIDERVISKTIYFIAQLCFSDV